MWSRVCTAMAGACALACGGQQQDEAPGTSGEPSLPAECLALSGVPAALLVDDFEDGDERLAASDGLSGVWYVENDGTGTQVPPAGERAAGALLVAPGAP